MKWFLQMDRTETMALTIIYADILAGIVAMAVQIERTQSTRYWRVMVIV